MRVIITTPEPAVMLPGGERWEFRLRGRPDSMHLELVSWHRIEKGKGGRGTRLSTEHRWRMAFDPPSERPFIPEPIVDVLCQQAGHRLGTALCDALQAFAERKP